MSLLKKKIDGVGALWLNRRTITGKLIRWAVYNHYGSLTCAVRRVSIIITTILMNIIKKYHTTWQGNKKLVSGDHDQLTDLLPIIHTFQLWKKWQTLRIINKKCATTWPVTLLLLINPLIMLRMKN